METLLFSLERKVYPNSFAADTNVTSSGLTPWYITSFLSVFFSIKTSWFITIFNKNCSIASNWVLKGHPLFDCTSVGDFLSFKQSKK